MKGRGRFFHQLLVAALERAIALAQVDDVPVRIGQDLDLDVPRPVDQFFQVDIAVPESRFGFAARGWISSGISSMLRTSRMPLPPPPAVALISRGKPIFGAWPAVARRSCCRHLRSRHDRHAGLDDRGAGGHLVAHGRDRGWFGPMKAMPASTSQASAKSSRSARKP
jgi:hypothetical protein